MGLDAKGFGSCVHEGIRPFRASTVNDAVDAAIKIVNNAFNSSDFIEESPATCEVNQTSIAWCIVAEL